jgi:hypothetical protein
MRPDRRCGFLLSHAEVEPSPEEKVTNVLDFARISRDRFRSHELPPVEGQRNPVDVLPSTGI